ncbi:uncharacterized protein LOC124916059 [Impatiens glandulifera]|uniref:uncharacterized protein LOC124916059 n=1 Tax=Impatiens glandulifera TaxID=253017 RepID=UPI001FB15FBF|nr:uncharacterized protein LOC124916059 [Impatiens glandulifera]
MGNCQAAEAATISIQYPGENKVEMIYWSVSAQEIMSSNPGYYVALVVTARSENGSVVRQLKVLRPADILAIGHVYRLISFEDVLKELAMKKKAKLGKLMVKKKKTCDNGNSNRKQQQQYHRLGVGRYNNGPVGQWKPALQSIAENGTLKSNF